MSVLSSILIFLTPLIFGTRTEELFEFPKMFFVYVVGTTLVFIFAVRVILEKNYVKAPNKLIGAFVFANLVSTIFSMNIYTSLWGYYSRFNGGLISIAVYFGIFMVLFNTQINLGRLLQTAVVTIFPIGLFGIYQHSTFDLQKRIYSTFGQPNWLAAYLAMILPTTLYFALTKKDKRRYVLLLLFILGYTTLWFTYSLSGLIGFSIGIAIFSVLNRAELRKDLKLFGVVATLCVIISVTNLGIYEQRVKDIFIDIQKVYAQQTEMDITKNNISDPGYIRLHIWKGTLNLTFSNIKRVTIGTGPETFPYAFQKYRPAELNYSSEWNYILNKPHNYYLEILSETGVVGLIPYLGILVYSIKKKNKLATPSLAAFYVTNLFGFPTVATALLFWVFLAKIERGSR